MTKSVDTPLIRITRTPKKSLYIIQKTFLTFAYLRIDKLQNLYSHTITDLTNTAIDNYNNTKNYKKKNSYLDCLFLGLSFLLPSTHTRTTIITRIITAIATPTITPMIGIMGNGATTSGFIVVSSVGV